MGNKFEATFESLRTYECPDWFRDVKFGIWSHWGPQSVPMDSDWYARNMYIQGSPQYQYHIRRFGHPSEFGFIDVCKLWKAEKFDPEELMGLFHRAGARYFMAQATHHDNFFNYESSQNRFNSVQIGPGKDICRMWKAAADQYGMYFGLSEHLAASYNWWYTSKGADTYGPYKGVPYDGCKEEYKDFYHDNKKVTEFMYENSLYGEMAPEWMTDCPDFHQYWENCMRELIDQFKPDLLYSDSSLPFKRDKDDKNAYQPGLNIVSYLYNQSIQAHGENRAVYTQKDRDPAIYEVGVLDVERSQLAHILPSPWQTDTCIGSWFYDSQNAYKRADQVIEMLVDIISKNGCLMLNIPQRPDGTIDADARFLLEELGRWFEVCQEGVYGTRPYLVSGEGPTHVVISGFTEDRTPWTSSDYRFVQKGKVIYAYLMKASENRTVVIQSIPESDRIESVRLLGGEALPFSQNFGVLTARLPEKLPTDYVNCIAIELT